MSTWIFGTIIAVQAVLLIASIYYNIKFGIKILNMQDSIEAALDVLDGREESMDKILKTPLFYDSPEIRRVHSDITKSRDAILRIANDLVGTVNQDDLAELANTEPDTDAEDQNVPV